jgi:hypothetical protein
MADRFQGLRNRLRDLAAHKHSDLSVALEAVAAMDELAQAVERASERASRMEIEARTRSGESLKVALADVIAQETEHANATVKRMTRIARAALENAP